MEIHKNRSPAKGMNVEHKEENVVSNFIDKNKNE